ncbi:hypothetical protein, partial [Enterobacter cloacae complex sp. IR5448]|uniref:hypothetical protein n=1 Tax=Enterobacter cloacae complex sp. IR5448 TaxID=3412371 RepID=UPI003B99DF73
MAGSSPLFFKASLSNMARASSRDSFALEEISARILNASTLRQNTSIPFLQEPFKEGANKRGNSSRLTQSFHFFMFEPIFSPVNALNQP